MVLKIFNLSLRLDRGTHIAMFILGIIEMLLAFRFILRMYGAYPDGGFTAFIYTATNFFVAPFMYLFGITRVSGFNFDGTTLLAMLVYAVLIFGIIEWFLKTAP